MQFGLAVVGLAEGADVVGKSVGLAVGLTRLSSLGFESLVVVLTPATRSICLGRSLASEQPS